MTINIFLLNKYYKYTKGTETVHNALVINILKGYFISYFICLKKGIQETCVKF